MCMLQFLLLIQEYLPPTLKEMWMEKVQQVLKLEIGMVFYYRADDQMDSIFNCPLVDHKLFAGSFSGSSYMQNILESFASKKYSLIPSMSLPNLYEMFLYIHTSVSWSTACKRGWCLFRTTTILVCVRHKVFRW